MHELRRLAMRFASAFNSPAEGMVRAPGRINLIGEHTDYNGGFVLPCALDLETITVFRRKNNTLTQVMSLQYPDYIDSFNIGATITPGEHTWANFVRGIFQVLAEYGFQLNRGLDLLISSNLPQDAGLASSAALATSVAGAIAKALKLPIDKRSLSLVAQRAEHEHLGKQCGIMDQFTATMSKPDHFLLIDCESFSFEHIPLPKNLSIVVFNSCVRREDVEHEYNSRRQECNLAASILKISSLRHATIDNLQQHQNSMTPTCFRRARHVVTENERTSRVAEALRESDTGTVFKLMLKSHESMKNDFEITLPETDALVEYCQSALNGKVGARMTGSGFGGSVIALCNTEDTESLIKTVSKKYRERFNIDMPVRVCRPMGGLSVAWLNQE